MKKKEIEFWDNEVTRMRARRRLDMMKAAGLPHMQAEDRQEALASLELELGGKEARAMLQQKKAEEQRANRAWLKNAMK